MLFRKRGAHNAQGWRIRREAMRFFEYVKSKFPYSKYAALAELEERLRALTDNAPDGIVIYGSSGSIEYASPATTRIMGYSQAELIGANPVTLTHPDDLPMVLDALKKLTAEAGMVATIQYRMQHKNGSWLWLESTITNAFAVSAIRGLVFNFRDVTARRQAAEKSSFARL